MKKYILYFELFGKKMKSEVNATSEIDAKQKILDKVIFHKIQIEDCYHKNDMKEIFDMFANILK
jgi:hypothetical protein